MHLRTYVVFWWSVPESLLMNGLIMITICRRKKIRQPYKVCCLETGTSCEFTPDDLQEFTINANIDMLKRTADAISEIMSGSAEPAQCPTVCENIAKVIRQFMSEWNASRYKATTTPKVGHAKTWPPRS